MATRPSAALVHEADGDGSDWSSNDDSPPKDVTNDTPKEKDSITEEDIPTVDSNKLEEANDSIKQEASDNIDKTRLFGEISSSSSDDEEAQKQKNLFGESDSEDSKSSVGEQEAKEQDEEREIVLDLEMIEKTRVDEQQTHLLKVPNFLHFDEKPFDRETFEDEEAEEEEEEDLQTRIKLKVENTIRWRFHNNQVMDLNSIESNAKFVKWSDGTMSLLVGSECFEVGRTALQDQHQFLFLRDRQSTVLQAQCKLQQSMTLRPHGVTSRTHKKLTATVLAKHRKTFKTKSYGFFDDPEAAKQQIEKAEQEKLRLRKRLESKQRMGDDDGEGGNGYYTRKRRPRQSRDHVDEEDEEEYDEDYDEEEDDGFVVADDEDVEMAEEEENEEEGSGSEIDWEEEKQKEEKLLKLKEQVPQLADKKRRLIVEEDD